MNITEVKVTVIENEMFESLCNSFDDCFRQRFEDYFRFPWPFCCNAQPQVENGRFRDIVHPLNAETRSMIEEKVISAYEEKLKDMVSSQNNSDCSAAVFTFRPLNLSQGVSLL